LDVFYRSLQSILIQNSAILGLREEILATDCLYATLELYQVSELGYSLSLVHLSGAHVLLSQ